VYQENGLVARELPAFGGGLYAVMAVTTFFMFIKPKMRGVVKPVPVVETTI
jgi:hypothetical protein